MSKTLVIQYLPRNERSNTKKILDTFLAAIDSKTEIETLDLIADTPELFLRDNLIAYVLRDMVGEKITPEQQQLLTRFDKFTEQLIAADQVVLAFPTYNFSFPAVVKAWFDNVMLAGKTWKMENGGYVGLLKNKKALIINSSGGEYTQAPEMEHALSLGKLELTFMGITDIAVVSAAGVNMAPDEAAVEQIVEKAKTAVTEVAQKWFG